MGARILWWNYRKCETPAMRVYAGQIDPNNPSHFTIRYEAWGQQDVLDCWLDDRDEVTYKPRNFPTPR